MRIGIITPSQSLDNYGQLLQCFALQHYLREMGHDSFLIKFVAEKKEPIFAKKIISKCLHAYKILNFKAYLKNRKEAKEEKRLFKLNKRLNIRRNFEGFRIQYIQSTDRTYHSIKELWDDTPYADIYITGSDQVWHDPLSNPDNAAWFLQFGDNKAKRISYAASIGRKIKRCEERLFKQYLSSFDCISLREQSACDYCRGLGFKDAVTVCDPTILLPIDSFPKADDSIAEGKPYVFFYTLNIKTHDEIAWCSIKPEIEQRKMSVKAVGSTGYCNARNIIPDVENIQATIPQWLSLINNASFVVTTSFHGTLFAIKMHRPFMAVLLTGSKSKANDRLTNLLGRLGLSNHIYNDSTVVKDLIDEQTDWRKVEKKIEEMKSEAAEYLAKSLR